MYKEIQILQYHGTIILQKLLRQTSTIYIFFSFKDLFASDRFNTMKPTCTRNSIYYIERGLGRVSKQGINA